MRVETCVFENPPVKRLITSSFYLLPGLVIFDSVGNQYIAIPLLLLTMPIIAAQNYAAEWFTVNVVAVKGRSLNEGGAKTQGS